MYYWVGVLKAGLLTPEKVIASDPAGSSREKLAAQGVGSTTNNVDVVRSSDVVIIAVKPDVVSVIVKEIAASMPADELRSKCFISIAAGVTLGAIEGNLPEGVPVIRVMPNTPCLVGECAAAYAPGTAAKASDKLACEAIFGSGESFPGFALYQGIIIIPIMTIPTVYRNMMLTM
jgi:pyrroline-5-carboxylate reductase